jgi:hypothetical protein
MAVTTWAEHRRSINTQNHLGDISLASIKSTNSDGMTETGIDGGEPDLEQNSGVTTECDDINTISEIDITPPSREQLKC